MNAWKPGDPLPPEKPEEGKAAGPGAGDPTEEEKDRRLIEMVAAKVVQMGLAVPAIFFLESTKPLSYVGSQALVFLEPFVKTFLNLSTYDRFTALMEDRKNIETLIVRIEDLDEQARKAEKERKAREKEEKRQRGKGLPAGWEIGTGDPSGPGLPGGGRRRGIAGWFARLLGRDR